MKRKFTPARIAVLGLAVALGALGLARGGVLFAGRSGPAESAPKTKVTVYKTPTCGCCANYIAYLKRSGFEVETVNMTDLSPIKKDRFRIAESLQSCHTTVIGDRFVEGHIPVEAMRQFLADPQTFVGIAMPGMPSGAPGMPGAKTAPFVVSGVAADGSVRDFATL